MSHVGLGNQYVVYASLLEYQDMFDNDEERRKNSLKW